jgi:recombination protein RecR
LSAIDELVGELARLPGIGRKTALRLAFHLLKAPEDEARKLSRAIQTVRERVRSCTECGNLTEQSPCEICRSTRRDGSTLCVVEEASDIMAIERTGEYRGRLPRPRRPPLPLDGVGPAELNVSPSSPAWAQAWCAKSSSPPTPASRARPRPSTSTS